MGSLTVITGPPGAGKSSVAQRLAREEAASVLIEGDAFFRFLARGAIDPWLSESNDQNIVVTQAAASAAGAFASGGYETVYDGVVGPWFLSTFGAATGLEQFNYVILLPPVHVCVRRVAKRPDHGFTSEAATHKMHANFADADIAARHVLHDPPEDVAALVELIKATRKDGKLTHPTR